MKQTTTTTIIQRRKVLEREAEKQCTEQGHALSTFATYAEDPVRAVSEAYCKREHCVMYVQVNAKGEPHLQITGLAPRFKCEPND